MLCPPPPPPFSFLSPAVIDLFPQLHVKSEPDELCLNLLSAIHVSFTRADSSKVDDKKQSTGLSVIVETEWCGVGLFHPQYTSETSTLPQYTCTWRTKTLIWGQKFRMRSNEGSWPKDLLPLWTSYCTSVFQDWENI